MNVAAQCHAPRGSKLFVITKEGLEVLCKAFECAPTGWFVDTVNQGMIASGDLVVKRPALAGTMNHYSERCGKKVEENELAEKEGEFLMLGRIYDHVECQGYINSKPWFSSSRATRIINRVRLSSVNRV